ncbi:MAG: hypothetical protein ACI9W6_001071 [Motiliproteus sp.]|jgi:hypothetical protein
MLTYEDCCDLCEFTEEEIAAIAEHQHLQRIQALATAEYLVHTEGGERMIRQMIIDDIRSAHSFGNVQHEKELKQVLLYFLHTHPRHACKPRT